jgi:hypothetical protein
MDKEALGEIAAKRYAIVRHRGKDASQFSLPLDASQIEIT